MAVSLACPLAFTPMAWAKPALRLAGKYSGGTGEPNNPYRIATPQDLNDIGNHQEDWNKNFILINDVNLAGYTSTQFKIIGRWIDYDDPNNKPFTGVFDGNDHKIWNFTWSSTGRSSIGLFGYVVGGGIIMAGGRIKNLGLENVDVNAVNGDYVGGLVGANGGVITNCYSTGKVSGTRYYVGGLVGYNGHVMTNCYSTGTVDGNNYVGGLVGYNDYGTITNSYSTGSVSGTGRSAGGLIGYNNRTITNCYSTGNVTGGQWVGGLVGEERGAITNSYSTGSVTGRYGVGGLVGYNYFGTITNCCSTGSASGSSSFVSGLVGLNYGTIINCYSISSVTGSAYVGGLVGKNGGTITNCYSRGTVGGYDLVGGLVGDNDARITNCYSAGGVSGVSYVGGLVGTNYYGTVMASFWDIETSEQSTSSTGTGKTTANMKTANTFAAWGACGNEGIWTIDEGNDYPRLAWEDKPGQPLPQHQLSDFLEGSGTEDEPYLIFTAEQLNLVALFMCEWDKHFVLANDIDLSGYKGPGFNRIGVSKIPFTGVFDGNDHKIWNFTWASEWINDVGLFGYVDTGAQIKNIGMENVDVNCVEGKYVGGLVGENNGGVITNCYSTGSVIGKYWVGALVGSNCSPITNCYSTASVSGHGKVGGLVGDNYPYGTITNCYSTGSVAGSSYIGGLVGTAGEASMISNCYSTGSISGSDTVGGLVGLSLGTITDSYCAGNVTGDESVGGLLGRNPYGTIINCRSKGSVFGTAYVGGLVGDNYGRITDSYCTGSVTGNEFVGGLVGENGHSYVQDSYPGWIYNCYSTGRVLGSAYVGGLVGWHGAGEVRDSFWDIETSYEPNSTGGTGKTTAEMQTKSTFTGAGWDFVNVWDICEGINYPRFIWQIPIGDLTCPDGVDFTDFAIFASAWQSEPNDTGWNPACDISQPKDNFIDELDLAIFCENWLEGPP